MTKLRDDAGMITQQLDYSILTAPLAAIDRRALSQAWYSALHLARSVSPAANVPQHLLKARTAEAVTQRVHIAGTAHRAQPLASSPRGAGRSRMKVEAPERRAVRSPLARRIERTFLDPARPVRRATFSVAGTRDGKRARVHVALQSGASGMRLVAVCPAALRAVVARALDQARYALALRGISLVSVVQ
ncbi:MAG: hypothetical protein ABR949_04490 [Candidatus Aquilonibacter sp.]